MRNPCSKGSENPHICGLLIDSSPIIKHAVKVLAWVFWRLVICCFKEVRARFESWALAAGEEENVIQGFGVFF